eukprot:3786348-Rhodomonas_salina.1
MCGVHLAWPVARSPKLKWLVPSEPLSPIISEALFAQASAHSRTQSPSLRDGHVRFKSLLLFRVFNSESLLLRLIGCSSFTSSATVRCWLLQC